MASHAAALGVIKYDINGRSFTFPGDSKATIVSNNVRTKDGRSIKYVEHTLTVTGWLYATDLASATGTVDSAFAEARNILSQSCGKLTITGKGFGDYYINRENSRGRDLKFGPFTEVIEWEPFGNITCRFTWKVKFTLPWKDNIYTKDGILSYTWDTSYSYDEQGFCSRTVSAEIEMAGSLLAAGNTFVGPNSNIEQYLFSVIGCRCPTGWHRTGHTINIDNSKTKATLTFTDEADKGLTFPEGIADMRIQHKMSSQAGQLTLSSWIWTFIASAVPQANFNSSWAYQACINAHQQRFLHMARRAVSSRGVIIPMPAHFEISEDVNERRTTLVASWVLMAKGSGAAGTFTPTDILYRSGMWVPFNYNNISAKKVSRLPGGPDRTGAFSQMLSDVNQNVILEINDRTPYLPDIGKARGNPALLGPPDNTDSLIVAPFGMYVEFKVWISCEIEGGKWVNYPLTNERALPVIGKRLNIQLLGSYNKYRLHGVIARVGMPPSAIPEIKRIGDVDVVPATFESAKSETYPDINVAGMVVWVTKFSIPLMTVKKDDSNPVKATVGSFGKKPGNTVLKVKDGQLVEVPLTIEAKTAE